MFSCRYDYRDKTIENINFNNIDADSKQKINDVSDYLCFENVSGKYSLAATF